VAQWVERLTLGFGLGRGLGVVRLSPVWGLVLGMESAWDSVSPSLPSHLSPVTLGMLSLSKKKEMG